MAHRVIAFLAARARNYRGFVTNSMFAVGAKTFPKCSSSFSEMSWRQSFRTAEGGTGRPGGNVLTAASLPSQTMNHATELKASSPPRRPLHFPFLRALAAVALARSTFSAVRTTSSNDVIAHHCCVMAFAPSSISPTIRRPLDTSDHHVCIATELYMAASPPPGRRGREMEIRRKIMELKKEGKIKGKDDPESIDAELDADDDNDQRTAEEVAMAKLRSQRESMRNNPVADAYADKIKAQLGGGRTVSDGAGAAAPKKTASLGRSSEEEEQGGKMNSSSSYLDSINSVDASMEEENDDDDSDVSDDDLEEYGMSEDDLFELVAAKMAEKKAREAEEEREEEERRRAAAAAASAVESEEREAKLSSGKEDSQIDKALKYKAALDKQKAAMASPDDVQPKKATSGIGGSWAKNETATEKTRRPSRGSWGYFERPNDISKAYGGGKRVGAGYTKESTSSATSVEETRRKLQAYREKVGIDVQSEKDNAAEIEAALSIGQRAMERGMYGTAVSALEKVTKWCSTNSQLGGKVFLELAMAYEAVGRTQEAIRVYGTLSKSKIEEIKFNAKRLLYGIEAMQFMRDEAKVKAFQKRNVQDTFIETTGMNTFAENFDDRYNTAWIDMDSGFFRQLTESVVRGIREARQVVLQATGSGEVDRRKVVQALRSMSRYFDDALEKEIEENAPQPESVAIMDGKPILEPKKQKQRTMNDEVASMEQFILAGPEQMKADLKGEWRLQLLADKRGDGVKYFNNTEAWLSFDVSSSMTFESSIPQGFLGAVNKNGDIEFDDERRIYTQTNVKAGGGGFLQALMTGSSGAEAGPNGPQQIISVDGVLLVTKYAGKGRTEALVKNYFAVWRRVEPGTYSSKR